MCTQAKVWDGTLLLPLSYVLQENTLALTESSIRASNEEHLHQIMKHTSVLKQVVIMWDAYKITTRNKMLRDLLMVTEDSVSAWGIYQN